MKGKSRSKQEKLRNLLRYSPAAHQVAERGDEILGQLNPREGKVWPVARAARLLGISPRLLWQWIGEGLLPADRTASIHHRSRIAGIRAGSARIPLDGFEPRAALPDSGARKVPGSMAASRARGSGDFRGTGTAGRHVGRHGAPDAPGRGDPGAALRGSVRSGVNAQEAVSAKRSHFSGARFLLPTGKRKENREGREAHAEKGIPNHPAAGDQR